MSALGVTPSSPRSPATTTGPARFAIAEDVEGAERCLRLRGELDLAAAPGVRERVREAALRHGVAVVDLSGVEFIDVAGLSALTVLAREARHGRWFLELRRPSLAVRQLVRLTGTQGLLLAA